MDADETLISLGRSLLQPTVPAIGNRDGTR
jgi:hypothetical protein